VEVSRPRFDSEPFRFAAVDLVANIALYVPIGIALRRRRLSRALAAGAALSAAVEVMQLFYLDRHPSLADVAANSLGVLAGWTVSKLGAGKWLAPIDPLPLNRRLVILAAALCAGGVYSVSRPGPPSDFANWDRNCRLIVGDELTRDRPWRGSIETLAVFDRALARREVEFLSRGGDAPLEPLEPVFLAAPLAPVDSIRGKPLLAEKDGGNFHDRLAVAGRMSVFVRCATDDESQSGPARIAGYSLSTLAHNFSLGQEGREIVFRLRTRTTVPGGFYPQTRTRPVLSKGRRTAIAATYDGRNVRVFRDGRYEARLNLFARGRVFPFLSDSGLPAAAAVVGMLMGIVFAGLAGGARVGRGAVLAGALGGVAGGLSFLAAGGADAFPEFARWIPVLSVLSGAAAGGSVCGPLERHGLAAERGAASSTGRSRR
jgi:hypothetical protein